MTPDAARSANRVTTEIARLRYMWDMCLSAARDIYSTRPPSSFYAYRVARLLFGTGAHESAGFFYNRQIGFRFDSGEGGHGYWQQEVVAIQDCIRRLDLNPDLRLNAAKWLFETKDPPTWWFDYHKDYEKTLYHFTCMSPRLSCLWARLYYLRDPEPVPFLAVDQASYWGKVYNTRNEAEKNERWESDYWHYMNLLGLSKAERGVETEGEEPWPP